MSEPQNFFSKKITLRWLLGWVFGVLFAISGLVYLFTEPIPGLVMLAMAAVILPPVTKLVEQKWKFRLSGIVKTLILIIGFILFGTTMNSSEVPVQKITQPETQKQPVEKTIQHPKNEEQETVVEKPVVKETKTEAVPISSKKEKVEPKEEVKKMTEPKTDTEAIIESHCQSEWPSDASMKAYCIGEQREGLVDLAKGKPADVTEDEFSVTRTHCEDEWPTDFKMRAYCEGEQFSGVRTLNLGKPSDIGNTEFNIIRPDCAQEWPTDYKMRAYCESEQYDAVRTLSMGEASPVRTSCANEWPRDYKMRVYCEKQN